VREIREKQASREAIVEAKTLVQEKTSELAKKETKLRKKRREPARTQVDMIEVGMPVWVGSIGTEAVVERILDGGRKAQIRAGKSKAALVTAVSDLFHADALPKREEQVVAVNVRTSGVDSYEIDLRGMVFEEAREAVEDFLDRLHMAGYDRAHIIHGKGTGALRKKIGAYLDGHPYVESQRLGEWNEGSSGVTVVTLKKE
jgi:DNA mismatch repair protein MutS2